MQIHDLPNGTIGATEYAPIDNGTTNRKTTLSAIGTYIINNVTEALGGVTRTIKAAIDDLKTLIDTNAGNITTLGTKLGSGSISNVGADVSEAIGNDVLGTTATSLSGAIAEHEGDINSLTGTVTTLNGMVERETISDQVTLSDTTYIDPSKCAIRFYKVGNMRVLAMSFCITQTPTTFTAIGTIASGHRPPANMITTFTQIGGASPDSRSVQCLSDGRIRLSRGFSTTPTESECYSGIFVYAV